MMLLNFHRRNQRKRTFGTPILCIPMKFLVLDSRLTKLFAKLFILDSQLLYLPNLIKAAAVPPTLAGKCDRDKKAGDKKADGKRKNKRNDPLKKSGVTHILHLLKTSPYLLR